MVSLSVLILNMDFHHFVGLCTQIDKGAVLSSNAGQVLHLPSGPRELIPSTKNIAIKQP